jgi:hypothetical protein
MHRAGLRNALGEDPMPVAFVGYPQGSAEYGSARDGGSEPGGGAIPSAAKEIGV